MALTTWKLDPAHTDIQFSAKHLMVTTVRGKFATVDGTLLLDEEHPTNSSGVFVVEAASLYSGVEQRDAHLRGADFLDTGNHPAITFETTKVEAAGGSDYRVTGNLTIRGVVRPATFEVEYLGRYQGFGGGPEVAFRATTTLNREDWDLNWNMPLATGGWLVGKDVRLEIDVAAVPAAGAKLEDETAQTAA